MQKQNGKLLIRAALFFMLLIAVPTYAQDLLIGASTRNGSFEDGVLTPWVSGHDVQILRDAAFASEGLYFASLESSFVRPVLAGQTVISSPNEGLVFELRFDARVGTPGLDRVSLSLGGRTPDGISLDANITPLIAPPLTTSTWESYRYLLELPAPWGDSGINLGISFSADQPLGGIPHTAYLDNVSLIQVPEPSALALVTTSALAAAVAGRCRNAKTKRVNTGA